VAAKEDVMKVCLRWMIVSCALWAMLLVSPVMAGTQKHELPAGAPDELPTSPAPQSPDTQVSVLSEIGIPLVAGDLGLLTSPGGGAEPAVMWFVALDEA
jgi:hypothetical protein